MMTNLFKNILIISFVVMISVHLMSCSGGGQMPGAIPMPQMIDSDDTDVDVVPTPTPTPTPKPKSSGNTLLVSQYAKSGYYTSIQDAITASKNGDSVIVTAGTYNEDIDFQGKAIVVKSETGANATVIKGNGVAGDGAVTFSHNETSASVLDGFTIDTSTSSTTGVERGIYISNASPIIQNNFITSNVSGNFKSGGGIYAESTNGLFSPIIKNNKIEGNKTGTESTESGGGICIYINSNNSSGVPIIENNSIRNNNAKYMGDGILIHASGNNSVVPEMRNNSIENNYNKGITIWVTEENSRISAKIKNNVVAKNITGIEIEIRSSGQIGYGQNRLVIENNTIVNNENYGIYFLQYRPDTIHADILNNVITNRGIIFSTPSETNPYDAKIQYNDILVPENQYTCSGTTVCDTGNAFGNILIDPMFVEPYTTPDKLYDLHLMPGSPCSDTGSPDDIYDDTDGSLNDMGAYGGPYGNSWE